MKDDSLGRAVIRISPRKKIVTSLLRKQWLELRNDKDKIKFAADVLGVTYGELSEAICQLAVK